MSWGYDLVTRPAITLEYLTVAITADVLLDAQTVELAFMASASGQGDTDDTEHPAPADWVEATWIGDPDMKRRARILLGPAGDKELAKGMWRVWFRVNGDPEIPARPVTNGWLLIT